MAGSSAFRVGSCIGAISDGAMRVRVVRVADFEPENAVVAEDAAALTKHGDEALAPFVGCRFKADLIVNPDRAALAARVAVLRSVEGVVLAGRAVERRRSSAPIVATLLQC